MNELLKNLEFLYDFCNFLTIIGICKFSTQLNIQSCTFKSPIGVGNSSHVVRSKKKASASGELPAFLWLEVRANLPKKRISDVSVKCANSCGQSLQPPESLVGAPSDSASKKLQLRSEPGELFVKKI